MDSTHEDKSETSEAPVTADKISEPEIAGKAVELDEPSEKPVAGFPIVGIGASAGGLAAFEAFFSGMPAVTDPDMAFVLVQHLAPDHKSIIADLIRRYTRTQVFEVEDGMGKGQDCQPARVLAVRKAGNNCETLCQPKQLHKTISGQVFW